MAPRTRYPEPGDDAWPIIGIEGVWELIRECGGSISRSYLPKVLDELPDPHHARQLKWWWRGELVQALKEIGRIP